ncbi:ABC transporter permease [Vibrio cholerae]|nr:ABC transporter permease [Vibrio cholerae]
MLGISVTAIVGILAFGYAYALTRSCMPGNLPTSATSAA